MIQNEQNIAVILTKRGRTMVKKSKNRKILLRWSNFPAASALSLRLGMMFAWSRTASLLSLPLSNINLGCVLDSILHIQIPKKGKIGGKIEKKISQNFLLLVLSSISLGPLLRCGNSEWRMACGR